MPSLPVGLPMFLYLNQISSCKSLMICPQATDTVSSMAFTDFGCIPQTNLIPQVVILDNALKSESEDMITHPVFGNSREAYIPSGTTATSVMQVFGGSFRATTIILRVYQGSLTVYRSPVLLSNMYNRWFKVNVIHDVGASNVKVYIDGVLRYEGFGAGGSYHYFKFGVYAEDGASNYMESRWRRIRVLRKNKWLPYSIYYYKQYANNGKEGI
ncbi:putative Citrate-binding protein precursor [Hibiscus syriacus]|uniref:Citrate-binding protein n=1 Tax=Hibiscus syriacus TaxID=106335 RepID=A0A6A3AU44_HIBSY|nr:putative Citrate-binding protein precursor [Hibiscus syriacus]